MSADQTNRPHFPTHKQSPSTHRRLSADEHAKRAEVLKDRPGTILVKIKGPDLGFPVRERDERKIEQKHVRQGHAHGVDPHAYGRMRGGRSKADTGLCLIEKKDRVALARFLWDLEERGYRFCGGHAFRTENQDLKSVLQFSLEGEAQELPSAVRTLLVEGTFFYLNVWANRTEQGSRLDTVNCSAGADDAPPSSTWLVFTKDDTNRYRLKDPNEGVW